MEFWNCFVYNNNNNNDNNICRIQKVLYIYIEQKYKFQVS